MSKVNLFFETINDAEIESSVQNYKIIRLKCGIQFKTKQGWSKPYSAIIDTGAHTSVIPLSIWKDITTEIIGQSTIFGLSKKEECALSGELGKITIMIIDQEGSQTKELKITAFLAETDQVPIIIGFNGMLEKVKVTFNFQKNNAYIED